VVRAAVGLLVMDMPGSSVGEPVRRLRTVPHALHE